MHLSWRCTSVKPIIAVKRQRVCGRGGTEGAINNHAADRKPDRLAHHNNEVIAARCERMIAL